MLRIKRVGSYSIPRYPREVFKPWREPAAMTLMKRGTVSAALLVLLESCDGDSGGPGGIGVTGPPPMNPGFLTENEARTIITNVFTGNGIQLIPDVTLSIVGSQGDTTDVVLDGYNESLRVGYEYRFGADASSFTTELIAQLDADAAGSGPYIKVAYPQERNGVDELEYLMQAFIDTLKAHGKI